MTSFQDQIVHYTQLLIESLKQNYVEYSVRSHRRAIENLNYTYDTTDSVQTRYHEEKIEELKNGDCPINYVIESGKKYHKVIFVDGGGSRSVHCFVDKMTGDVYKSASWKAPAKGVRYALLDDNSREQCYATCDWSGGYLYA